MPPTTIRVENLYNAQRLVKRVLAELTACDFTLSLFFIQLRMIGTVVKD